MYYLKPQHTLTQGWVADSGVTQDQNKVVRHCLYNVTVVYCA